MQRLQPNFMTDIMINFVAQHKQRKKLILTDGKRIFLLTVPNQYNAYSLKLWLIALKNSCISSTVEATKN